MSIGMSIRERRGMGGGAVLLAPAALGSFGIGAISTQSPLAAVGAATIVVLTLMPWRLLFVLLSLAAIANVYRIDVASVTFQPAHLVLIPLALRVFLVTSTIERPRWHWPETVIVAFIAIQGVSSLLFSPDRLRSVLVAGLLALGVLAYLTTYFGLATRNRLLWAARVVLVASVVNSGIALLALAAHYLVGTSWGVSTGGVGAPAAGLAHEYNIQGSMSAAAAIGFLLLLRDRNPLFSRWLTIAGFSVCLAALVASLTRGAWIAFAVALLASLIFRRRRVVGHSRLAALGVMSLAVGLGALAVISVATVPSDGTSPNALFARGTNLVNVGTGSGQNRVSEWQIALDEWPRSPVVGLGTNTYGQRHAAPKKTPQNAKGAYLGNLYIRTLYDSGLIGLLLLGSFMAYILWPRRMLRVSTGELAPVAWAFTYMYLTLAVAYVVTDASFQIWPWIIIGVARASRAMAVREHLAENAARTHLAGDAPGRGPLPASGLVGIGVGPSGAPGAG